MSQGSYGARLAYYGKWLGSFHDDRAAPPYSPLQFMRYSAMPPLHPVPRGSRCSKLPGCWVARRPSATRSPSADPGGRFPFTMRTNPLSAIGQIFSAIVSPYQERPFLPGLGHSRSLRRPAGRCPHLIPLGRVLPGPYRIKAEDSDDDKDTILQSPESVSPSQSYSGPSQ